MEILRNLFGSLTSGIIRLLVTVGILAAAYFFIVKPVLNTTDNAINSANKTFEKSFERRLAASASVKTSTASHARSAIVPHRKARQPQSWLCIQRPQGDVNRIQRCTGVLRAAGSEAARWPK